MSSKEIQVQIDSKIRITDSDEMRRQLCLSRNTFSLINILPTEILVRIFLQVIAVSGKSFVPLITHVCTHWRSIALSTPFLWVSHFPHSRDGIQIFLERSKNAPLYINIQDGLKGGIIDYWPLFRPLMYRTRELSFQFGPKGLGIPGVYHPQGSIWHLGLFDSVSNSSELILNILNNIPECIESLEIMLSIVDHSSRYWAPPLVRPHGLNLFSRLRRLHFRNFRFDWGCGIIKDLHVLIIRNDSIDIGWFRENLQIFLDVVEACPRIQHLELVLPGHGAEENLHLRPSREGASTPLAYLQTATISGSLGALFLTRFTLPVAEAVDVWAQIPATAPDDVNAVVMNNILGVLSRRDYPLIELNTMVWKGRSDIADSACFHVTAVIQIPSFETDIKLVGQPNSNMQSRGLGPGYINFRVFFQQGPNIDPQIVLDGILQTEAPAMTRLGCHFHSPHSPVSPSFWTRTFSKTPHLEILSLERCSFAVFTSALMALEPVSRDECPSAWVERSQTEGSATDDECSNPKKLPLPHLKELIIPKSPPHHVSGSRQPFCTYEQVKELVERCLSARAKYGCKIENFHVPRPPHHIGLGM